MDLAYLHLLLPDAEETTLEELLQQHESELSTLRTAADEARQGRESAEAALTRERRNAAAEKALGGLEFSSHAARESFLGALNQAELPMEDGELQGFHGFLAEFRAKDPGAFRASGATMKVTAPGNGGARVSLLRKAFGLG